MASHNRPLEFIGGSDVRITNVNEPALRHDMRCWYETIGGRMPIGWHVVTLCYATAAILVGWWPWNILLLLLLFPIRNTRVRHSRTERNNAADLISVGGSST
jgi:hypothetical protein